MNGTFREIADWIKRARLDAVYLDRETFKLLPENVRRSGKLKIMDVPVYVSKVIGEN